MVGARKKARVIFGTVKFYDDISWANLSTTPKLADKIPAVMASPLIPARGEAEAAESLAAASSLPQSIPALGTPLDCPIPQGGRCAKLDRRGMGDLQRASAEGI
jgi:hypothetical protein